MEKVFVDQKAAKEDGKMVGYSLKEMGKAAKFLTEDGILVTAKDLFLIATNKKTIQSLYVDEATERLKSAPKYRFDAEIGIAKERAEKCPPVSNVDAISAFSAKDFSIDADTFEIKINADVEKTMKIRHTKELTAGQLGFISLLENYGDSAKKLNKALEKLGQPSAKIESPYLLNSGTIDLEAIAYRVHL